MMYTHKFKDAIAFSIQTHEIDQKQKRKGKDIAYITHPLTVALILSRIDADEDVVLAGILHDTIEDSVPEKKVTKEMIAKRFGDSVAELVDSVTEEDKELSWEERKRVALGHIADFSHESLLVKSADILSNTSEIIDDYERDGEGVFARFNAPKEKILQNYLRTISALIAKWSENPLAHDLRWVAGKLQAIGAGEFMPQYPAHLIEYREYDKNKELECPVCGWRGVAQANTDSHYALDVSCPVCEKMLLVASYPSAN